MRNQVAILLPSYRRKDDLENVLKKTAINKGRFIVVANYPADEYNNLSNLYSDRADFIDETRLGKLGVCGAYNEAFKKAVQGNYKYCVLYADDVLPFKKNWLDHAVKEMEKTNASIGVFSSDEGHYSTYGWNIIKDAPIGHFFIARISDFKMFFDPRYKQYVIDLEIVARTMKQNKKVLLLPIRVRHYRSPLNRESYGDNYKKDLELFLKDYPEYKGWMNSNGKESYIPEGQNAIEVKKGWQIPKTYPWPAHKIPSKINKLLSSLKGF